MIGFWVIYIYTSVVIIKNQFVIMFTKVKQIPKVKFAFIIALVALLGFIFYGAEEVVQEERVKELKFKVVQ